MGCSVRRFGVVAIGIFFCWPASSNAQVNVTTYHNDNARTGQNVNETALTPDNVNSASFGKLYTTAVDGAVYAQPLYLSDVEIGGETHNVVYAATQHDSVYAIDADTGVVYWQKSLIPAGGSAVNSRADLACGDIATEVGITGTPVIDSATGTLYAVAMVKLNGVISQHLHALDVRTGTEKFGAPHTIEAALPGAAPDGEAGMVGFAPRHENQRSALLLENGHVLIAWTSHCDNGPWHGWVMSYGATTLTLEGAYNTSTNGYGAGIWMSGGGMAADTSDNIYLATGNGSWNATDRGDSILKLGAPRGDTLPVRDYFTPYNQRSLTSSDKDLSAGGLILLPTLANGKELAVVMGKEGTIYLLDRNNLGRYCVSQTPACVESNPQIVQQIDGVFSGFWGTPAYWNGNLYWGGGNGDTGEAEPIKAYSFDTVSGKISAAATSVTARRFNFSGPVPSVSANGNTRGIVWGIDNARARANCAAGTNCQTLYAYDATDLTKLLYSSVQAPDGRDLLGQAIKFVTPTIANGKVYVASGGSVSAFGLLNAALPAATAPRLTPAGGVYATVQSVAIADATPGAVIHYTVDGSAPTRSSPLYAGAVRINTSTTLKAFAVASGHSNSAVSTATYTISTIGGPIPGMTRVNLAAANNVYAVGTNGVPPPNGGLDTASYALSGTLLGTRVSWSGVSFELGSAGAASAVSNTTIPLPAGNYAALNLLAAGVGGNQVSQEFTVTYTDDTKTTFTQSVSDWFTPQNYAGESRAVTMAYVLTPTGAQRPGSYDLYGYTLLIDGAKTVKSLTLPPNDKVVLFAAELTDAPPDAAAAHEVNLSAAANVHGVFSDGTPVTHGGFDRHSAAYSEKLLGTRLMWNTVPFTILGAQMRDAVVNATVPLPAGKFSHLNMLAAAINGSQVDRPFLVHYTDGTETLLRQSISDWYEPQSYPGEFKAISMAYRLGPSGAPQTGLFYTYAYALAIDCSKTVKSVTLPDDAHVVVLSLTLTP